MKKRRAKKPKDAPRRPKSAYMFFLAEFREKWKVRQPACTPTCPVCILVHDQVMYHQCSAGLSGCVMSCAVCEV